MMTGLAPSAIPAQLPAIADAIPHIVWMADPASSTEYIPGGWDWLSAVHPDDAHRALRGWADARRDGAPFELECRLRHDDGSFRWHSLRTSPLREDGGRIAGWLGTATDIDKQKRSEGRFHRGKPGLTANEGEGLYTSDTDGCFTFVNAAAERMLGWSAQELDGTPVCGTAHFESPDESPPLDDGRLRKPQTEGAAEHGTDAFTRKDGSMFPVSYSAAPLGGEGPESGVAVVFRDTTDEGTGRGHSAFEQEALTWVARTRDALDQGRLILYSQPVVPLAGGKPSEELLLRMIGLEGEILRPASFLPPAEKYGLIREIDRRVVTEAARLAASGRRVQANLSALSISSPDLRPLIEDSLRKSGAAPGDLVFEITETALMEDVEKGAVFARDVAEIGCDLALDDFGTGYGSFTRLKRFPTDYLKIDIEFVRDLVHSPDSRHVVEAIISLAEGFGQQTIAEGVEDAETLEVLEDLGVDFAQGYYLGRPAPLPDAAASVLTTRGTATG